MTFAKDDPCKERNFKAINENQLGLVQSPRSKVFINKYSDLRDDPCEARSFIEALWELYGSFIEVLWGLYGSLLGTLGELSGSCLGAC